jgi:hypothetical protein
MSPSVSADTEDAPEINAGSDGTDGKNCSVEPRLSEETGDVMSEGEVSCDATLVELTELYDWARLASSCLF